MGKMKIIVGLGNPGEKYRKTRHNIGFDIIDYICSERNIVPFASKYKSLIAKGAIADSQVVLAKPQQYMNNSGEAVLALMGTLKVKPEDIIVVYDDFALRLGQVRIRKNGSAGGHNGIKSIIANIGENFVRVRIGIGCPGNEAVDFVLSRFSIEEAKVISGLYVSINECIEEIIVNGIESAMNKFNR